jgi:hypothetical protein
LLPSSTSLVLTGRVVVGHSLGAYVVALLPAGVPRLLTPRTVRPYAHPLGRAGQSSERGQLRPVAVKLRQRLRVLRPVWPPITMRDLLLIAVRQMSFGVWLAGAGLSCRALHAKDALATFVITLW